MITLKRVQRTTITIMTTTVTMKEKTCFDSAKTRVGTTTTTTTVGQRPKSRSTLFDLMARDTRIVVMYFHAMFAPCSRMYICLIPNVTCPFDLLRPRSTR